MRLGRRGTFYQVLILSGWYRLCYLFMEYFGLSCVVDVKIIYGQTYTGIMSMDNKY